MLKRFGLMTVMTLTMVPGAHGVSYQYDNAGRLRVATYCSTVTTYALDAAGNRITVKTTGSGGGVPAEDPSGGPDALSFTAAGVQITAGQTLQIKVDRLCPTAGALNAAYVITGAPTSDYSVTGSLNWAVGDTSSKFLTLVFTSTPSHNPESVYITLSTSTLGLYPSYQATYGGHPNTQPVDCTTNPQLCV